MATYSANNHASYRTDLVVTQKSQSVANNSSIVTVTLKVVKLSGSGYWTSSPNTSNWSINIGGHTASGTFYYDFRNYTTLTLHSKDYTIAHGSDGKKTLSSSASVYLNSLGTAKPSGSLTLTNIPRQPNAPTLSISSTTRSSVTVAWSTNLSSDRVSYQLSGGSWTTLNASGTSGSFTISGLGNGTSRTIGVQVRGSASSLWSTTRNITGATNHVSSLSSYSLVPTYGYNNRLTLAVKGTQTGGSTTIQYKLSTASTWNNTTGGSITGLSNGTTYTVNLRAINSSGEINTYNISAKTHTQPTGSFSLSQSNKTIIRITHSSANATHADYSLNGAAWVNYTSGVSITGRTPGTTYTVRVRLRNTSTGLTTDLGTKSIAMTANVVPGITITDVVRNSVHGAFYISGASSYRYRINGGSWVSVANSSKVRIPSSGNYVSNTTYTIEAQALDSSSGQWGGIRSSTFKTAAFRAPTLATSAENLTSLAVSVSRPDSCTLTSVTVGGSATNATGTGGSDSSAAFTSTITTVAGTVVAADTSYKLDFVFKDEYSNTFVTVSRTLKTKPVNTVTATIAASSAGNTDITSLTSTNTFPKLTLSSNGSYEKSTTITLGTIAKTISWTSSSSYQMIQNEIKSIVALASNTYLDMNFTTTFSEGGRTSPTKSSGSVRIHLNNSLLTAPTFTIAYNNSERTGMVLQDLYSRSINSMKISYDKPVGVEGKGIKTAVLEYNEETVSISTSAAGTINLGPYETIIGGPVVLEIEDVRGLKASYSLAPSVLHYLPPSITMATYGRQNGFTEIVELHDVNIKFTPSRSGGSATNNNTVTAVYVEIAQGNSGQYERIEVDGDDNLMEYLEILNTGISGSYSKELVEIGRDKEWFSVTNAYSVRVLVADRMTIETGLYGVLANLTIPTGKGLMFFDEYNRQVGVNTTAPRGRFEVDGDSFFTDIYPLNAIIFDPDDVEIL